MRERIRRIRKKKTWVDPTGWEMNKGKLIILTGGLYLLALISILNGANGASIAFAVIASLLTIVYVGTEQKLRNRFKDIEEKVQTETKHKPKI